MLHVGVVTLFPEMVGAIASGGVTARAIERGLVMLRCVNPREFAADRHRSVDDRPYGGGPGMVMRFEPLRAAIHAARDLAGEGARTVHLSPQGRRLDAAGVARLAAHRRLVLVCGRYEGIDERLIEAEVDEEVSIGDFVLSGGELPAMVLVDAMTRLVPGALGHEDSAGEDSFARGLLEGPCYTRPETAGGRDVPEVLLSGDHAAVRRWRLKQALGRTFERRPDLLARLDLDAEQRGLLEEYLDERGLARRAVSCGG